MFVSEDMERALVNVVMLEIHGNMTVNYVKLNCLEASALYEDIAAGQWYHGNALMEAGVPMPVEMGEYLAYQIELRRKQD